MISKIVFGIILGFVLLSGSSSLSFSETEGFSQTREEIGSEQFIKTHPELRSSALEKIHKQIIEWKSSSNPEVYARNNNLIFSDNKIQVYIYLDSTKSIVNIPQDIDVIGSDENIAVAFVSSEQINQLAQLDFVEQISPPILATISPIPISQEDNENENSTLIGIGVVIAIVIIVGVIYSKKRKGSRNK